MASRPRSRLLALLGAVALFTGACSQAAGPDTTSGQESTTTAQETTSLRPTTTPAPSTSTTAVPGIDAEVLIPDGSGPFPTVVMVHGGGWVVGSPGEIRPLARHLTEAGFLTVNARYKLSNRSPGFPQAIEDLVCAVRFAAVHPSSDGTVAIVGFSAGAHLSALVALTGDQYGQDCPFPGSGVPDRLVGLAGPYDAARLGTLIAAFFGQRIEEAPDLWDAGNPLRHLDTNPELTAYLLHGGADTLIDASFADAFHQGLLNGGATSTLHKVEGARHSDMSRPEVVGDLIVEWLRGK